jgi:hypothetical protein
MDQRHELINALAELWPNELRQLALYLLEDDKDPLGIIDGRKWRWHEHKQAPHNRRDQPV